MARRNRDGSALERKMILCYCNDLPVCIIAKTRNHSVRAFMGAGNRLLVMHVWGSMEQYFTMLKLNIDLSKLSGLSLAAGPHGPISTPC